MNGDHMEADHRRLDNRIFTDDEEVTLLPHKRDMEIPDNPDADIRDKPDMSDTQREDWLLQMEPLHGARPRQTDRQRPPMIDRGFGPRSRGGYGGRKMDTTGIRAPLLPLERQILLEGEVTTPPRGAVRSLSLRVRHRGGGGIRPLSLRVHQEGHELCLRFFLRSVHGMVVQTDGRMLDRRYMYWLTNLLGCNRTWQVSVRVTIIVTVIIYVTWLKCTLWGCSSIH